jgi:hypothetical protein
VAVLNSLDTAANGDGFYIGVPVPAKSFTFDLVNLNTNASTLTGYYFKNDFTWASLSITDNTKTGGNTTLGVDGSVTFSPPTDIQPKYMFGKFCYWYLFVVSAALDAAVSVASVTYDTNFNSLVNMWDGT